MPAQRHVFTSESVTEGHPDKIADQISDAVLDAIIAKDPAARVACETLVTTGMAVVAGEITTSTYVHIPDIRRGTFRGSAPTARPKSVSCTKGCARSGSVRWWCPRSTRTRSTTSSCAKG